MRKGLYICIQSRLQLVGIFYLSEQLSDFFQQLNVKFFEDPNSDKWVTYQKEGSLYQMLSKSHIIVDT